MTMEDHLKVVIDAEDSSSHTTSGLVGLHRFIVMPRYLVCSPAFIFMLLTLCLATSTVNMLMHTPVLFQCLSFLLLVCCTRIFSRLIVTALVFFHWKIFCYEDKQGSVFCFCSQNKFDALVLFFNSFVSVLFNQSGPVYSCYSFCYKYNFYFCNCKLLVHSLNRTSNVIEQLNKIVVVNLSFFIALVWCLLLGFEPNKFIVFMISSLLFIVALYFRDYFKMISEGIMLALVMHPFDIGDHCIIDNEQVIQFL